MIAFGWRQAAGRCGCGPVPVCTAGIPASDLHLTWLQTTLGLPDCTNTATLFYTPGVVIGSLTVDAWTSPVIHNCGASRQDTIIQLICFGGEMSLTLADPTGITGLFIITFTPMPAFLIQAIDEILRPKAFFTITP